MLNDIVKIPYQPTQNEDKTINDIKKRGIIKEDWTSKRKGIKSFISKVVNVLIVKWKCCLGVQTYKKII